MSIVFLPNADLSSAKEAGKGLVRKQILPLGKTYRWPGRSDGRTFTITERVADEVVRNFSAGLIDTIPFFKVNDKNQHVEDPERARGRVVALERVKDGVDAIIEPVTDAVRDLMLKTQLAVSPSLQFDYKTHDAQPQSVGAVLRHVAWTPEAWMPGMRPFEPVLHLSGGEEDESEVVVLSSGTEDTLGEEGNEMSITMEDVQKAVADGVAAATAEHNQQMETLRTELTAANERIATFEAGEADAASAAARATVTADLAAMVTEGLPPAIADLAATILTAEESGTVLNLSGGTTATVGGQVRAMLQLIPKVSFTELGEGGAEGHIVLSADKAKELGLNLSGKEGDEEDDENTDEDDAKLSAAVIASSPHLFATPKSE